ncbi:MAG TPA: phenylalanine--tRNA ligase beta subunit-related protein [Roseiflexaceae bacterium]|nr:phenylalanine--tRNA ligase beta subunit-related protein [Roseiflexaceae bacterium]
MYFEHTPAIWAAFPSLAPGILLIEGVRPDADVAAALEPLFARARARLAGGGAESNLPEIQAWRRAFSQMGLKPTQYRSAAEALLRRFRKEGALPALHPLVDLCNAVSLAYALPVAVIDLDQVEGFIAVRHADGDEVYLAFSGETEHPEPGEVIFADAARQVHARRWTFRQSRRSTVGLGTRRALVVSEGLHAGARDDVAELLATLEGALHGAGFAPSRRAVLSAAAPRWESASDAERIL